MSDIESYYKDEKNCYRELGMARNVMTNPSATEQEFEGITKSLAFMYCYCPEDIMPLVQSTLDEAHLRKSIRRI